MLSIAVALAVVFDLFWCGSTALAANHVTTCDGDHSGWTSITDNNVNLSGGNYYVNTNSLSLTKNRTGASNICLVEQCSYIQFVWWKYPKFELWYRNRFWYGYNRGRNNI